MTTIIVGTVFTYTLLGLYKKYLKKRIKNFISKKLLKMN